MDSNLWRQVIAEALPASLGRPLLGTNFRALFTQAAAKRGTTFPPADEPDLRFVEFLERFPDLLAVRRRPGKDVLLVPAGRPELWAAGLGDELISIRQDVFDAFTQIRTERPYYDASEDAVHWSHDEPENEEWIPIPAATLETELQVRRSFSDSITDDQQRGDIIGALGEQLSLNAFSRVVRQHGLQRLWHAFRTERLVERIRAWAKASGLVWKDHWLVQGRPSIALLSSIRPLVMPSGRDALIRLFSRLDQDDLRRVSIPLDLVVKAFSR